MRCGPGERVETWLGTQLAIDVGGNEHTAGPIAVTLGGLWPAEVSQRRVPHLIEQPWLVRNRLRRHCDLGHGSTPTSIDDGRLPGGNYTLGHIPTQAQNLRNPYAASLDIRAATRSTKIRSRSAAIPFGPRNRFMARRTPIRARMLFMVRYCAREKEVRRQNGGGDVRDPFRRR